ncbi:MAG TPA: hypothetical protein VFR44_02505 [Actinomycetota bacterium]|nr:hypothetical protein [Actinomycetota bacterium]
MSANSEVLRGRAPVQVPAWLVIGVALALAGALAVVTTFERETVTTRPPSGTTVSGEAVAQSDAAEMAELKSAVALQLWAEQHGIVTEGSGASEAAQVGARKRATAMEFGGTPLPKVLHGDNTAPVVIDGEICGQCR